MTGTHIRAHGWLDMCDNIINATTTSIPEKNWHKAEQPIVEEMHSNSWSRKLFKENISKTVLNNLYSRSRGRFEVSYDMLFESLQF